jgi:hypothetical protein
MPQLQGARLGPVAPPLTAGAGRKTETRLPP